mgnify:CR=1 FL=1
MLSKDHSPHLIRSLEGTSRLAGELGPSRHSARRRRPSRDRCRLLRLQLRASRVLSAQPFPAAGAPAFPPQHPLRVERPRGQCCPLGRCPEAIGPKLLTLPPARSFSSSSPRVKPRATGVRLSALQLIIAADRGHTDAIQLLLRRGTQANFVAAAVLVSEKHCSSAAAGVASVGGRD